DTREGSPKASLIHCALVCPSNTRSRSLWYHCVLPTFCFESTTNIQPARLMHRADTPIIFSMIPPVIVVGLRYMEAILLWPAVATASAGFMPVIKELI